MTWHGADTSSSLQCSHVISQTCSLTPDANAVQFVAQSHSFLHLIDRASIAHRPSFSSICFDMSGGHFSVSWSIVSGRSLLPSEAPLDVFAPSLSPCRPATAAQSSQQQMPCRCILAPTPEYKFIFPVAILTFLFFPPSPFANPQTRSPAPAHSKTRHPLTPSLPKNRDNQ